MSMFDYDARPVTPGVVLVGTRASRGGYAIRDFLSRNGYPFEWVDADQPDAVRAVLGVAEVEPSALPLCILPDGSRLVSATVEQVAAGLGMVAAPSRPEYDLAIVGAGPAGLAAAVNAASEGLRTVVIEAVAPGGQAGTTSRIDNLLGAGVYYGAGPSEAMACTGSQVVVVGGGNSAGQAVVRFSRYAQQVTLLVRGRDLGASMSQYLIDQLSAIPNVEVRVRTQVVGLEADDRLRAVNVRSGDSTELAQMPADALFICIGGTPRTDGAAGIGLATSPAGYLVTGSDGGSDPGGSWPLPREPLPLETNRPGVFAAGDVRCGSVKRCSAAIGEGSMAVALVHRRLAELGGD